MTQITAAHTARIPRIPVLTAANTGMPSLPEGLQWDVQKERGSLGLNIINGIRTVGSVKVGRSSNKGYISCFSIAPSHQGQGLAQYLLRGALARGGTHLDVAAGNLPAIRTYRHHLQWDPSSKRMYVPGTQPEGVTLMALPRDPDVSFAPAELITLCRAAETYAEQLLREMRTLTFSDTRYAGLERLYRETSKLAEATKHAIPARSPEETMHLWLSGLTPPAWRPTGALIIPEALQGSVDRAVAARPEFAELL